MNLINKSIVFTLFSFFLLSGANANYCNSLWDKGKRLDSVSISQDKSWNNKTKRYLDKVSKEISGFDQYVKNNETMQSHNDIRQTLLALSEYVSVLEEEADDLQELTEEEIDILNEIENSCPLDGRYEEWIYNKIDIQNELYDSRGDLVDELLELQEKLEDYSENPAELIRRIDLFYDEIQEIKKYIK